MSDIESIKVTVLGKPIPLRVKESEVENTRNIAAYVDEQLRLFRNQFANQPDSTIMILACLKITEELFEMRASQTKIERSEEHTSELQSRGHLVCRLLLEKKKCNELH